MATDIFIELSGYGKPVVIYAHGFNGFKDWGRFDLIAGQFATRGYVLVKFNFSHNGTTPEQPEEFTDLNAFGENNYTKELDDLGVIIDWVCDPANPYQSEMNISELYLCGHSMGGGIVILKAAEDRRIKKLVTWAAISECKTPWGSWPDAKMNDWKKLGVQYYTNTRTKQEMPLYYQLFEDYQQNRERLNIEKAIRSLTIPVLICHGSTDPTVPVSDAHRLHQWQPSSRIFITDSDHVFGRKHPWEDTHLPKPMQEVVNETVKFFKVR